MNKIKLWNYRRKIKTIKIKINGIKRDIVWLDYCEHDGIIYYCCKEGKKFPVGTENLKSLSIDKIKKKKRKK